VTARRFAYSNIAWDVHDDPDTLALLRANGVTGIEVAPTKVWPEWEAITLPAATAYRDKLHGQGFEIPALQALLFGRPQARLFDEQGETELLKHLEQVAAIAGALGAQVAVFGAPKQRDRGDLTQREALEHSAPVLRRAAARFADHGSCLCIEPNPRQYGCNFIRTAAEGAELVRAVDHEGFKLHLDAAQMYLENEDLRALLPAVGAEVRHFHISEPGLGDFLAPVVPHADNLRTLDEFGYTGWCSVEMRKPSVALESAGPWKILAGSRSRSGAPHANA
jgi:sugar phosphate isomerase/epimerase